MTIQTESLNFHEIETPWEPQPIAWRYDDNYIDQIRNKQAITDQIENPDLEYLVREVQVKTRHEMDQLSVEETWDDLQLVDRQFNHLEAVSQVKVAPYEWHVFEDAYGVTRTLARVAIIDGRRVRHIPHHSRLTQDQSDVMAYELYIQSLRAYQQTSMPRGDTRQLTLSDIDSPLQYIMGSPRNRTLAESASHALYLVDIEPLLGHPASALGPKALPISPRGERIA